MVYHWRMNSRVFAAIAFAALPVWAGAQEFDPGTPIQQPATPEERQAREREQEQKLRRAREELEMRRNESARRLEGEQLRQSEIRKLEEVRAALGRRESYLGSEIYWTQRERDSLQWKDPADLSSMARRTNLDHQMYQYRNELDRSGTLNQGLTNQLNSLQRR
jgi:hypothetical protein